MKYIALLNGVNVGGTIRIEMAAFKEILESLGLSNVETYVQSGNAVFEYGPATALELQTMIENGIESALSLSVKAVTRTAEELERAVLANPFLRQFSEEQDKLHVIFLSDVPSPDAVAKMEIRKEPGEEFELVSKEIYLYCPNGYGASKLTASLFERKLGVKATNRNWNSVNHLHEMTAQGKG